MGIIGKKGTGFAGTIIKDPWTITRAGWKQGREVGELGWWGGVGGKGRKLYLNNNKQMLNFKKVSLGYTHSEIDEKSKNKSSTISAK